MERKGNPPLHLMMVLQGITLYSKILVTVRKCETQEASALLEGGGEGQLKAGQSIGVIVLGYRMFTNFSTRDKKRL